MKRLFLIAITCVLCLPAAQAGDKATNQTIAYVQKMQTSTGGFVAMMAPNIRIQPTLRATSSGVRALHYLGGELPNKPACVKFVESCWNAEAGGFADTPTGQPDVFTTAVGLMAVTELGMPAEKYAKPAIKYLSDNAKSFEDIRIAAAGLERLKAKAPKNDDWLKEVTKLRNTDGTFGKGPGLARDTGGSVVTLLRLGGDVDPTRSRRIMLHVLKTLKEGQRANGGYGKGDDETASDLETTYRVLRCFVMLGARPGNVEGMRAFVARCRNDDGGYGVTPGQPSNVSGTYFAAIITHWLKESK